MVAVVGTAARDPAVDSLKRMRAYKSIRPSLKMNNLNIKIKPQKDYECLSSCLKAVFDYYKKGIDLEEIIQFISDNSYKLYDWEFKAGRLAIKLGLNAMIYTNVTQIFDPSWHALNRDQLLNKLKKELSYSKSRQKIIEKEPDQKFFIYPNKIISQRITDEIKEAINFLVAGGKFNFEPISTHLIEKIINNKIPIITSFNPVLLHRLKRVYNNKPNDIRGLTWGHVIIIAGYDKNNFIIKDPDGEFYRNKLTYKVNKDLMLESILRYNGQLIVIKKR